MEEKEFFDLCMRFSETMGMTWDERDYDDFKRQILKKNEKGTLTPEGFEQMVNRVCAEIHDNPSLKDKSAALTKMFTIDKRIASKPPVEMIDPNDLSKKSGMYPPLAAYIQELKASEARELKEKRDAFRNQFT